MSQFQEQTLDILLKESIVNIPDLSINYNDSLYINCPKLKKYCKWIGVCMNCFEDHSNQIKYIIKLHLRFVKIEMTQRAIKGSELYEIIDINNFTKVQITQLSSITNIVLKEYEIHQQQQAFAIDNMIEQIKHKTGQSIIEQKNYDSLAMIFKKNQLHNNVDSKVEINILVKCDMQLKKWNGYCPICRLNKKHEICLKQNINQSKQPISSIEINKDHDYRLIDISQFKQKIQNYLLNEVLNSMLKLRFQNISKQKDDFMKLFVKYGKNNDYINSLKRRKRIQQQLQQQQQNAYVAILQEQQIQSHQLYDIQINCANLTDLTTDQGWKVVQNQFYEQRKDENCAVVSFYGFYNKGKSFLAEKLSEKQMLTGYSVKTIGLSAIYPRDIKGENSIVFLDTSGLETPIHYHRKDAIYQKFSQQYQKNDDTLFSKIYEAKTIDRLLTENLIQQFILNQSHLILIVVDQLSKEEQNLIKRIKTNYQQSEIVIVHNFSKLTRLEEIQKYIQIDIVNSFEIVTSICKKLMGDITGSVYIEQRCGDQGQDLPSIIHVIMAQEHSEAGYHYNPFCYQYLVSRMISINQFKKFDIIKSLMAEVEQQIYNLFQLNPEQQNLQYTLKYDTIKNAIITNLPNVELKPISLDILGCLHFYDQGETPKYNYQVTDNKLLLNVELCCKFEPQFEDLQKKFICKCEISGCSLLEQHGFHYNNQLILLRGKYLGAMSPLLVQPAEQDHKQQRLNRFQLIVPISPMVCILEPSKSTFTFQKGIGRFEFQIQNKNSSSNININIKQ